MTLVSKTTVLAEIGFSPADARELEGSRLNSAQKSLLTRALNGFADLRKCREIFAET